MTISSASLPVVQMDGRFMFTTEPAQAAAQEDASEAAVSRSRFVMKGIAFPNAPLVVDVAAVEEAAANNKKEAPGKAKKAPPAHPYYNPSGWIAVLKQLREALPDPNSLNVIRLYDLDILNVDYSEFFEAAESLGFYVMVPLTSSSPESGGILNRLEVAPDCYNSSRLFDYGRQALLRYLQYPNVVAALVGNEVMNAQESWPSAPCLAAYARDLKKFQQQLRDAILTEFHNNGNGTTASSLSSLQRRYQNRIRKDKNTHFEPKLLPIPLMYAAQDSGVGAALNNVDALRLTMDYLSCHHDQDNNKQQDGIDIFGVNIESWCSSFNQYEFNEDGSVGNFYKIQQGLQPILTNTSTVPKDHQPSPVALVFSELGCSHHHYNHDAEQDVLAQAGVFKEVRDWNEIPVILQEMGSVWSGYCAYAYWGNPLFNMMDDGPWDGDNVLPPGQDFHNFQIQSSEKAATIPHVFPDDNEGYVPHGMTSLASTSTATKGAASKNITTSGLAKTAVTTTSAAMAAGANANVRNSNIKKPGVAVLPDALPMANGGIMEMYYQALHDMAPATPTCEQVEKAIKDSCTLDLYPLSKMPMYSLQEDHASFLFAVTTMTENSTPHRSSKFAIGQALDGDGDGDGNEGGGVAWNHHVGIFSSNSSSSSVVLSSVAGLLCVLVFFFRSKLMAMCGCGCTTGKCLGRGSSSSRNGNYTELP